MQSTVSPNSADGPKSAADIMALFGKSGLSQFNFIIYTSMYLQNLENPSTTAFSSLPTGGFPATAYGLGHSQFASPAAVPAEQPQMPLVSGFDPKVCSFSGFVSING